jgi:hypothetical protein
MGFIIGFSTIILIVSSNLIIYNGNYLSANRPVEVSSDVDDFENRYFFSNPLEELNRLCQNKPDDLMCNRLENDDDESKDSDDTSDKRNEQREKLGQLLEEYNRNNAEDKKNADDENELKLPHKTDIEKLKEKIYKENNKHELKQEEENKAKFKNFNDKEDEEDKHESKITSLKIQNIRDSLEKKLDLLKDRTENKKDNQFRKEIRSVKR